MDLELPTQPLEDYGDWRAEARSMRHGLGLLTGAHLDVVCVRGRDGRDFLHRMLTADLRRLPAERAAPAALLTAKARVISTMTVVPQGDETLCVVSRGHRDALVAQLDRFIVADDVSLSFGQHAVVGLYGPGLRDGGPLGELVQIEAYRVREVTIGLIRCTAVGDDHLATPGLLLIVEGAARQSLIEQLQRAGARPCGWRAYECCRVEAGTPQMGAELSEEVLILEAGQLSSLSFDKGCYPGQEPVCRIHNRGQVNRLLVGLRLECERLPLAAEKLIHSDKEDAGWLTSVTVSQELDAPIALGYVHRKVADVGARMALEHGGWAEVVALPHVATEVWPLTLPKYAGR